MSKSTRRAKPLSPWMSARPDNIDRRFIQVGNSLLLSDKFQKLKSGAQHLYMCMSMEAGGQKDFTFPQSAAKKYGIAPKTLQRNVDTLVKNNFIRKVSGANLRVANQYTFTPAAWKNILQANPPS